MVYAFYNRNITFWGLEVNDQISVSQNGIMAGVSTSYSILFHFFLSIVKTHVLVDLKFKHLKLCHHKRKALSISLCALRDHWKSDSTSSMEGESKSGKQI